MFKREDFKSLSTNDVIVVEAIRIRIGAENKIKMNRLAFEYNLTPREVRDSVEHLILLGYPIGNINGYFWINTEEERAKVVRMARNRLASVSRRYNAVRKMANINQETFL